MAALGRFWPGHIAVGGASFQVKPCKAATNFTLNLLFETPACKLAGR